MIMDNTMVPGTFCCNAVIQQLEGLPIGDWILWFYVQEPFFRGRVDKCKSCKMRSFFLDSSRLFRWQIKANWIWWWKRIDYVCKFVGQSPPIPTCNWWEKRHLLRLDTFYFLEKHLHWTQKMGFLHFTLLWSLVAIHSSLVTKMKLKRKGIKLSFSTVL